MSNELMLALSGGLTLLLGFSQLFKFFTELKDRKKIAKQASTKEEADRDALAIKGQESAFSMMQSALNTAQMSEGELRVRVRDLESEARSDDTRILDLEHKVRELEVQLSREREDYSISQKLFEERLLRQAEAYEARLTALERNGNGEVSAP